MTHPTTNRGVVMPASTDLVTDLPADFAVFGDAVDLDISSRGGYTTVATAAGTTTLTVTSNRNIRFTGTTTQNCDMPVASTLAVGARWVIQNKSTGIVTVRSSGGNTIYAIPANTTAEFVCVLASGTTAASWDYDWAGATSVPGGFDGASVYKASGQVITGATWTTLLFDTENFDTAAFHDTSSNTGRMTVPSGKAGYYELTAVLNFYCTDYNLRLLKNGSNVTQGLSNAYIGQDRYGGGAYFVEYGKFVINLAVGDYLEVQFLNSVGVTLDAQVLQLVYLGA